MINAKEAHKLYIEKSNEHEKLFNEQDKELIKEIDEFLTDKLVSDYLDKLVKEHAAEGEAQFVFDDFLKEELQPTWDKKAKELKKKYPEFTKLNDPINSLRYEFLRKCSNILADNKYISVNRYYHIFAWVPDPDEMKSKSKFKFIDDFFAQREDREQFKYYIADHHSKLEQQRKDEEETRKMTKFAKILAKELGKDNKKSSEEESK